MNFTQFLDCCKHFNKSHLQHHSFVRTVPPAGSPEASTWREAWHCPLTCPAWSTQSCTCPQPVQSQPLWWHHCCQSYKHGGRHALNSHTRYDLPQRQWNYGVNMVPLTPSQQQLINQFSHQLTCSFLLPGLCAQTFAKRGIPFHWLLASTGWEEASALLQAGVRMIISKQ